MEKSKDVSMQNIYKLDGRVPLGRAVPFGLQHVLAMFVSNLTPITNVYSRYCNVDSVVSNLESWSKASDCDGC